MREHGEGNKASWNVQKYSAVLLLCLNRIDTFEC